jgi:hypothetical protein
MQFIDSNTNGAIQVSLAEKQEVVLPLHEPERTLLSYSEIQRRLKMGLEPTLTAEEVVQRSQALEAQYHLDVQVVEQPYQIPEQIGLVNAVKESIVKPMMSVADYIREFHNKMQLLKDGLKAFKWWKIFAVRKVDNKWELS